MKQKRTKKAKLGLIGSLCLMFIILKLTGVTDWPWIWVMSPVWITAAALAVVFILILVGGRLKKGRW